MTKITILGAGVIGMTIASQLPKDAKITIVGEYLPGDEMTPGYPSQWAGAIWLGTHNATPREQVMQLGGLAHLWKIAERYPESSVRKITMNEVMDYGSVEDVWYRKHVMDFRMIPQEELPKGANYGMRYTTLVITPPVFIAWLRRRLEDYGVIFKRLHVKSLKDLEGMGHDVLINASGWGSTKLEDVRDEKLVPMKQQNIRIRNPGYNRLYIRRGLNNYYSTAFARHDGSIYIGGVKTEGLNNFEVNHDHRAEIMRRQHENQPDVFPSANPMDYDFITDHVGVYHVINRGDGGVRVEKQIVGNQKVVHAYGMEAGGFVYSFGLGREAAHLVDEFLYELPRGIKVPQAGKL